MNIAEQIEDLQKQIDSLRAQQQQKSTARLSEIAEEVKALLKEGKQVAKACGIDFVIETGLADDYYDDQRVTLKGDPHWDSSSAYC